MSRVCELPFSLRGGLPAVHDRHFKVHQNDVRPLGSGHLASSLAIFSGQHFEIAK